MTRSAFVLVVLVSVGSVQTVRADDGGSPPRQAVATEAEPAQSDVARPPALTPLIAAYVGLQALDIASTYRMDPTGRSEANPIVRNALGSPPAVIAMKAGSAAL